MTRTAYFGLLGVAVALLLFPALVAAQSSSVKCESNNGRRNYCGNYNASDVRLDRQISGSPCIQGQTWGVDRGGLWVDRGCRAYFIIRYRPAPVPPGGGWTWWNPAPGDPWPPNGSWHGGNWGSGGACFYRNRNFGGSFFCLRRGSRQAFLASYGSDISSIRLFGAARVDLFGDRNFSGPRDSVFRDVPDLRKLRMSQTPNYTWNNRVASLWVR